MGTATTMFIQAPQANAGIHAVGGDVGKPVRHHQLPAAAGMRAPETLLPCRARSGSPAAMRELPMRIRPKGLRWESLSLPTTPPLDGRGGDGCARPARRRPLLGQRHVAWWCG